MSIRLSSCVISEVVEDTLGGKTYWISHPDWPGEERALCFRPIHASNRTYDDERCAIDAGWGTSHYGEGACKYHGGRNLKTSNITHGKYAKQTKKALKARIDDFVQNDQGQLFDMTYELGALRVLIQEVIERFPNPEQDDYERQFAINSQRLMTMIQATGSLVDKISRIESRNTITAAQVVYLRAQIANILVKYITDPERRERAIKELAAAVPGGENDDKIVKMQLPG